MKMTTVLLCLMLFFTIPATVCCADDEPTTRPVGSGVFINSDCSWPLVVRPVGRCHTECAEDRDCGLGNICEPASGSSYRVCKPGPLPPAATGGFTGRVERALGEGVPCSIKIWPASGGTSAEMISCNAKSGGFMKEGLQAGIYLLRVTAGTAPLQSTRDFYAPVNPGTVTDLGALTVLIDAKIVNPSRRDLPEMDIKRDRMQRPENQQRPGQPPIR
jgi:hypothetical protein